VQRALVHLVDHDVRHAAQRPVVLQPAPQGGRWWCNSAAACTWRGAHAACAQRVCSVCAACAQHARSVPAACAA
jgi:hypothetical protein